VREPGDLDEQIASILGSLGDDLEAWRRVSAKYKGNLFCGVFVRGVNQGDTLSPATMIAIAERGLELQLDIYALDVPTGS